MLSMCLLFKYIYICAHWVEFLRGTEILMIEIITILFDSFFNIKSL